MEERITPHLTRKIKGGSVPITKQFVTDCIGCARFVLEDPLGEESKYSPVKGLIHKYPNRVLWKVTYRCAAHCRFCTRSRQIGSAEGDFDDRDIKVALQYLCNTPEVDDVILSGGDPLYAPKTVINVIAGLHTIDSVRVLRIDTRLPIHAPTVLKSSQVTEVLRTLKNSAERFAVYVLVHINHHTRF